MKSYYVRYRVYKNGDEKGTCIIARSKQHAYSKAVFEIIPRIEGEQPYSAWVSSVTYANGNYQQFNTCEGLPY